MAVTSKELKNGKAIEQQPDAEERRSISTNRTLWAWRSVWALGCFLTFMAYWPRFHWTFALAIAVPLQLVLSELQRVLWKDRTIYDKDGDALVDPETGQVVKEYVSPWSWGLALFALAVDAGHNLTGTAPIVGQLHTFEPLKLAYGFWTCGAAPCTPAPITGGWAFSICVTLGVVVAAAAEILRERALHEIAAEQE